MEDWVDYFERPRNGCDNCNKCGHSGVCNQTGGAVGHRSLLRCRGASVRARLVHLTTASRCELFFCQIFISKKVSWVKLFFPSSHKDISWMKLKKSSLLQLLPHFSVSTMHEVVGEAILSNTFSKTAQLHLESHS